MEEDLYAILGVAPEADEKEIRSAHRALAKKYHPDTGVGSSDERFRQVQRAYDVLGDEERRAAYDRGRPASRPRIVWAPSAESRVFTHRHSHAAHVDLRNLSRRQPSENFDLRRGRSFTRPRMDAWDELIAFLFGDLP